MRVSSIKPVAAGVVVAAAVLLSACGNSNSAEPASTVPSAPAGQAQQQQELTSSGTQAQDVNCSTNGGKVGPAGGQQVDLIAVGTKAGRVGCTEAFNVISDYYRDAPTKSEGTAHALTVQGWQCLADTGAQGTGIIGCDKGGLSFHTGQPEAGKRFAGKNLTVRMTGYDAKVDMVEFQLVRYIRGGANNGHYEGDPSDTAKHRLPLAGSASILSAVSICSQGLTMDSAGHANKPCTKEQLVDVLDGTTQPYAELEVDKADNIAKVSELYTP